jgi:SNF2 family DNA or RNA helicase
VVHTWAGVVTSLSLYVESPCLQTNVSFDLLSICFDYGKEMIVLHAGIESNRFLLWGEMPHEDAAPTKGRKQSRKRVASAHILPYDAGESSLIENLKVIASDNVIHSSNIETVIVWLPTVAGLPLTSSPLIAEPLEPTSNATLSPWKITALNLNTDAAVELLCACIGQQTLAPGIIIGKDLIFWATALRFAGSLVAKQQFIPGVEVIESAYCARWQPVFTGVDAKRLLILGKAMPQVCRALSGQTDAPPATPAGSVLNRFLETMVDYLVRSSVSTKAGSKPKTFESLHDQWLFALRSPGQGRMTGSESELTALAKQVTEWRRPIDVSTATPFSLSFRLEEPESETEAKLGKRKAKSTNSWYVRYLLQSVNDPSLLIPVANVWSAKGRHAEMLKQGAFNAPHYLLSSLGQAVSISQRIEASLKTSAPAGYELDATGAHEFLTEKAWLLEQAGFNVFLPAWWSRKGTKLRLSARARVNSPKLQGTGGMSLEEIVQFDWEVALGGNKLTAAELETLAGIKEPLVRLRGQWVQLNAEEIQAALAFWKKKSANQATVREVIQMALGAGNAPGGMAFEGVTATGWVDDLLAQLRGRDSFEEMPVSDAFHGTLRPYQVRGYSWLAFLREWGLGACLADDMGMGKTPQTLALIAQDWQRNDKRPTLIICPMSVVGNWQKEAARFTPDLPVMIHHGMSRTKGPAFKKQATEHAIVLSSFALLNRDSNILKEVDWAGVILDEAQNIKNAETKQSRAARSLKSGYRIALTGTPVENNVGDLWSIMEFLNPGFLGSQAEFKRSFFVPIQANQDHEAAERLKRLTGPFILRRLKTDKSIIADLPEKMEMKLFCTLTKEQASLYAAVVKDMSKALEDAEGIKRKGVVLATLTKLKQVCNHPAQFLGDNSAIDGRSGKLARLTEMLEEALAEGDRVLVFTQFAEMGKIIKRHLQASFGREVLFLHGAVPKKQRDLMVERFQIEERSADDPRIFILSLKAGGTGLNLTAANHVFHFDRWWNPAVENQATDRAFRIGQRRNVQVHKFLCIGTLEEKIDEMIERKQEIASSIVGTGEGWLTELSNNQLKELFALRREAISE